MNHALYICYFGLYEPLVQTQVLPYLREIAKGGIQVHLLTFETKFKAVWTKESIETEKQKLLNDGIGWDFLIYHKYPSLPATIFDVLNGARFIRKKIKSQKINILHTRTHIPALMAMTAKILTPAKLIFDIRGLVAEEYVDGNIWRENSIPFRLVKAVERKALKHTSQVIVLTNRLKQYLVKNNLKNADKIEVIPCCVDFSRLDNSKLQKNERFELIYAGSVTGLYLLEEMGLFFLELKKHRADAFFRILTATSANIVNDVFQKLNIKQTDYSVQRVEPSEVLSFMKKARAGISFRKPTFSQIAASPTKIPEYLAAGIPVISNFGIGDTDVIIESEKVGICVKSFDSEEYKRAVSELLTISSQTGISERCVEVAQHYFDLIEIGQKRYLKVYRKIEEEIVEN